MEKIAELLAKFGEGNVPTKIQNKLKSLERLNVRLATAKQEHEAEPTEQSKEQLDNVSEYVDEVRDELIDDLKKALGKYEKEKEIPVVEEKPVVVAPVVEEKPVVVAPIVGEKPVVETPEPKKEESNGIGWFGLLGGVVLLVATAGVINTLKK